MPVTLKLVKASEVDTDNPDEHDLYVDPNTGQLVWLGLDITDKLDYAESIAQSIKTRLLMIRGEWYLDQREGTPWRERIWIIGSRKRERLRSVFRTVIEGTPGVRELVSLNVTGIDTETRTATLAWEVVAETGQRVSTEQLNAPFIVTAPLAA